MVAVKKHMEHGQFFPRPADILRIIAEANAPKESSGEAWNIVRKAINKWGVKRPEGITFSNPAIERAVAEVGWRRLCLDEEKYARRDFQLAYERAHERYVSDVQSGSIAIGARAVDAIGSGNE